MKLKGFLLSFSDEERDLAKLLFNTAKNAAPYIGACFGPDGKEIGEKIANIVDYSIIGFHQAAGHVEMIMSNYYWLRRRNRKVNKFEDAAYKDFGAAANGVYDKYIEAMYGEPYSLSKGICELIEGLSQYAEKHPDTVLGGTINFMTTPVDEILEDVSNDRDLSEALASQSIFAGSQIEQNFDSYNNEEFIDYDDFDNDDEYNDNSSEYDEYYDY